MGTHNTHLTLLNVKIRTDAEGRYSLNDCHKAAGGDPAKAPGQWLRYEQAQALVAELTDVGNHTSPVSSVKGGRNQGTYVVKELVYAYAMWISPAFHLTVIRSFDAMMTKIAAPKAAAFDPTNFINLALSRFPHLSQASQQSMIAKVAEAAFGFPVLPLPVLEEHYASASEVAAELGVTPNKIGRIANAFGLKRSEFGIVVMDKSRHSSKQVEAFRYNRAGIEAIKAQLSSDLH